MSRFVWSKNLVKEEALAHGGFVAPKRKKQTNNPHEHKSRWIIKWVMKVLTVIFCNDTVASRADARFEFLTALAIKLIILISVDISMLYMYLIKFYENFCVV